MRDDAVMDGVVAHIEMNLGGIDIVETVVAVPGKEIG